MRWRVRRAKWTYAQQVAVASKAEGEELAGRAAPEKGDKSHWLATKRIFFFSSSSHLNETDHQPSVVVIRVLVAPVVSVMACM